MPGSTAGDAVLVRQLYLITDRGRRQRFGSCWRHGDRVAADAMSCQVTHGDSDPPPKAPSAQGLVLHVTCCSPPLKKFFIGRQIFFCF